MSKGKYFVMNGGKSQKQKEALKFTLDWCPPKEDVVMDAAKFERFLQKGSS